MNFKTKAFTLKRFMSIKAGDKLPIGVNLMTTSNPTEVGVCGLPKKMTSTDFTKGRIVLFGVPAAFSPLCHLKHLPGFVEKCAEFKDKKVDLIACMSNNDHFAMDAWGKDQKVEDKVLMVADGNGEFTEKLGLTLDLSHIGLGKNRNKRFALIAQDGIVEYIGVGDLDVSGAEAVLAKL